jgi:hypothetical protein
MPRGRKPRASQIHRPPCGFYRSFMGVLDAVKEGLITPVAAHLWQVIQAHSLQEGFCGMTDLDLGQHMGGMTRQQVANLRASLRAAGLLLEQVGSPGSNERRLLPLPGPGFEANGISRQSHLTSKAQEEEELINHREQNQVELPPPPDIRNTKITGGSRAHDGGYRGEGIEANAISRQADLASNRVTVNASAVQTLAKYLIGRGVFPRIAAELAPQFLARQDLADAKAEVMAWWFSVTEGETIQSIEDGDDERLRGRLVTRLRAAADGSLSPPLWALGKALDTLRELEQAMTGGEDADDATSEDDGWNEAAGEEEDEDVGPGDPEGVCDNDAVDEDEEVFDAPDQPLVLPGGPCELSGMSGRQIWDQVLPQLRNHVSRTVFEAYLAGSRFGRLADDAGQPQLVVKVAHGYMADWLNQNMTVRTALCRILRLILNTAIDVHFEGA